MEKVLKSLFLIVFSNLYIIIAQDVGEDKILSSPDGGIGISNLPDSISVYKGYEGIVENFVTINFSDNNGDSIYQAWTWLTPRNFEKFNWLSLKSNFFAGTVLIPPQGKLIDEVINRYVNNVWISTKNLRTGGTYKLYQEACNEKTPPPISTGLCVGGDKARLHVIPYHIQINNLISPDGSFSKIIIEWSKPDLFYWHLNSYAIFRNESDNIRISELQFSEKIKTNIGINDTLQFISNSKRGVNSYYAIVGYDSLGEAVAISNSYQVSFPLNNFSLLSPTDGQKVSMLTPNLDWEDYPEATSYTLIYSEDSTFTYKNEIIGITTSEYTFTAALSNYSYYYWKVKTDGNVFCNETGWNFGINLGNQPPSPFNLMVPTNLFEVKTLAPSFEWEKSADPGDKIEYKLIISADNSFTNIIYEKTTHQNYYHLMDSLEDNGTYYWKVLAIDSENQLSESSNIFSFSTIYDDEPSEFGLYLPTFYYDGMPTQTSLYPEFRWFSSFDNDGVAPTYTLWYSTDSVFLNKIEILNITDTTYIPVVPLKEDSYYYWKVRADYSNGIHRWSFGQPFAFVTNVSDNDPRSAPLLYPISGRVIGPDDVKLDWERPTDDIYDIHHYNIQYSTDPTFSTYEQISGIYIKSEAIIPELLEGKYYWKVYTGSKKLPAGYNLPAEFGGESISPTDSFEISSSYFSGPVYLHNNIYEIEATVMNFISWTAVNIDSIRIEFSSDGGSTWEIISESIDASLGVRPWRVPNVVFDSCLIRVYDKHDSRRFTQTQGFFKIIPPNKSLFLSSPIGGESFEEYSSYNILFNSTNIDSLRIELSRDNGNNWEIIVEKINPRTYALVNPDGYYLWTVLGPASENCFVKITDYFYPQLFKISNMPFSIRAYPITYVSKNGDDMTGDGSKLDPYHTIQRAINNARPGDSIRVSEGVYQENLVSINGVRCYIIGGYNDSNWSLDYLTTIIDAQNGRAIQLARHPIEIQNFSIINASTAIYFSASHSNPNLRLFRNLHFSDCDTIIYIFHWGDDAGPWIFDQCRFNQSNHGLLFESSDASFLISNSFFDNVNILALGGGFYNIQNNNFINSNTVIYSPLNVWPSTCWLSNNIFYDNQIAIDNSNNRMTLTVSNNLFYLNNTDTINCGLDHTNLFTNPLFKDTATGDYRLSNSSPCIGVGKPNELINDIEGNPRPAPPSSNPDIGAYENSRGTSSMGTITNVKAILEGLYDAELNRLRMRDTIKAYLRNIYSPYTFIDSTNTLIDSIVFNCNFKFLNVSDGNYYLVLAHRNTIETWSKIGGILIAEGDSISYDFTVDSLSTYGNNVKLINGKWCIYSGDINQDGIVDLSDISITDIDNLNFVIGYTSTDVNGDGLVDVSDIALVDTNNLNFVSKITPATMLLRQEKIRMQKTNDEL